MVDPSPTGGAAAVAEVARLRAEAELADGQLKTSKSGALVSGSPGPGVQMRIPLAMTNRHGLVIRGILGTGRRQPAAEGEENVH